MKHRVRAAFCLLGAAAVACGALLPATAGATAQSGFTVVASGFNNPRGLAWGPNGRIYVAEAGAGSSTCVSGGPEGTTCVGLTGGVSAINANGSHHEVVSGLASISGEGGFFATGPDGLSRNQDGQLYTIMTSCPQQVDGLPSGVFDPAVIRKVRHQAGRIVKVGHNGNYDLGAGVGRFDWNWSIRHSDLVPGQFPDCNPYGILAGSRATWVVDAATNTLDRVTPQGDIEIVAFFPNPPSSDAVPTCVDRGPDGALYVGELTGGGNGPGASVVWRVDTNEAHPTPTVWATGLTAVTGCGFVGGQFYATEFSTLGLENAAPGTGAVVWVAPHSNTPVTVADGLSFPNGFLGSGASIYVSNWSVSPAVIPQGAPPFQPGEVVRIHIG
jgi:hypothetical protein